MTKRFIATVAAAAIAFTAVASAPAKALDSGELGRLILGTGAVVLLGTAISNHNKNRNNTVVYRNHNKPVYKYNNAPVYNNRNVVQVPAYCIHGHGPNRWVDWNCARRAGY